MLRTSAVRKLPFIQIVGSIGMICAITGCSTSSKSDALSFNQGLATEESQMQRSIARFCDSAYVAVNQSQEITPVDVMDKYKGILALKKWTSGSQVAELTKAALISTRSAADVVKRYDEIADRMPENITGDQIAELTKVSIITETEASTVAASFKSFNKVRKWNSLNHPVELTKVALFTEKETDFVMDVYDELLIRQGKTSTEKELTELTKVAVLTGRSPNEIVKVYDQIDSRSPGWAGRARLAELTKIALLTNSSAKTVYYRFTEINSKKKKAWVNPDSRVLELTKLSLLGKRTAEDVMKTFAKLDALESGEETNSTKGALAFSLLSGEFLQDSTFGNNVDECSGAYARLILSIDASNGES